jgi:hypothetical protein
MSTANTRKTDSGTRRDEGVRPAHERPAPGSIGAHQQGGQGTEKRTAKGPGLGVEGDTRRPPRCDCIRARAFEIFQARSTAGQPGDAVSDWLRAEEELRSGAAPNAADNPPLIGAGRPAAPPPRERVTSERQPRGGW